MIEGDGLELQKEAMQRAGHAAAFVLLAWRRKRSNVSQRASLFGRCRGIACFRSHQLWSFVESGLAVACQVSHYTPVLRPTQVITFMFYLQRNWFLVCPNIPS